jgi:hypothetical protein
MKLLSFNYKLRRQCSLPFHAPNFTSVLSTFKMRISHKSHIKVQSVPKKNYEIRLVKISLFVPRKSRCLYMICEDFFQDLTHVAYVLLTVKGVDP